MIKVEINGKLLEFNDRASVDAYLKTHNMDVDEDGNIFQVEGRGVIPTILDVWFKERLEYRKLQKKFSDENNTIQSEFYKRRQLRQKIFLNSIYGTLGLPVFRFYDRDNAEAVTMSGQEIILSTSKLVNDEFLNRYKNKKATPPTDDFIVYIDTDSIYFSSLQLAKLEGKTDDMTKYTIDLVQQVANKINRFYEYMVPRVFNVAPEFNRIKIVPDVVAKKALWIVKKRYAMLKVFDMEKMKPVMGKGGEEGKLEVKGIDVVRSSYPAAFRKFSANILESILRGVSRVELDEQIMQFEENIEKYAVEELCKTSSVRFKSRDGKTDYRPIDRKRFQFVLGSPPQVKGALSYNDLLKVWKLHRQYESIGHSEKIKWCYLLPNDFNLSEIAFKGDDTDPDKILDFISHHIDRRKMYERELKSKLSEIYAVIGWPYPNRGSQLAENTFNFDEEW
ncbi:MAG TPA: DNA polymerase domain-containing protein [Bacteroidales bacterium]|nr:DNA polymerase domain-containing protein [Bacteroidales bacterium]